jgi:hypothetical protein
LSASRRYAAISEGAVRDAERDGVSQPVVAPRQALSALRLVSFVPPERDGVRVGMLTPDAQRVIELTPLGIADALDAITQLPMLRQAAGAIVHGSGGDSFPIADVHLVGAMPLARSVVRVGSASAIEFSDPTTVHGPGGHVGRADAAHSRAGLACVVGEELAARSQPDDADLDRALVASLVVLGWPQQGPTDALVLRVGAVGPYAGVPRRHPETLTHALVAPLGAHATVPDVRATVSAPTDAEFFALAREALTSHTLRAGDLLTIFPDVAPQATAEAVAGGTWVRVSAPGLGTLSLAVR